MTQPALIVEAQGPEAAAELPILASFAPGLAAFDAGYLVQDVVETPGTTGPVTDRDATYSVQTGATVRREAQLVAETGIDVAGYAMRPADSAIATVNASGRVAWVSDGTATATIHGPRGSVNVAVPVAREIGASVSTFANYVAGSLGRAVADLVDSMCTGTPANVMPIYSSQNDVTGVYVRNPLVMTGGLNLTAAVTWASQRPRTSGGVAIADDVVAFAWHNVPAVGSTMRFVTTGNATITRTIEDVEQVGTSDVALALLTEALPVSITPWKVLPATLGDYLPTMATTLSGTVAALPGLPVLCSGQDKRIVLQEWHFRLTPARLAIQDVIAGTHVLDGAREAYSQDVRPGDSGSFVAIPITGEACPVLCSLWETTASGPDYSQLLTEINAKMTDLGSANQLTVADLSAFTDW